MITDRECASLCVALYAASETDSQGLNHVDFGEDDGICWALKHRPDCDVVILRGSVTLLDWWRDLDIRPYQSRRMGPVHHGFYLGLDNAWDDMKPMLRPHLPIVVTGHSLGAARAALLTGMMIADDMVPARRVVFGEPKPGYQQLADFIKSVPAVSYRNGIGEAHDKVTDVPTVPGLPYVHSTPLTNVNAPPAIDDAGGFAWHHMGLYAEALANS